MKKIFAEDMFLTCDLPTAAGSKMLDGYQSLLEAEALTLAKNAGYTLAGKVKVGEFAIDLLGETSYFGAEAKDGILQSPAAKALASGEADAVLSLDVNGATRRAAAQNGLFSIKPTYGTVSRYGTVPVACSGETVSVLATSVAEGKELLSVITAYDPKDGTSLPEDMRKNGKQKLTKKNKVAILTDFLADAEDAVRAKVDATAAALEASGISVARVESASIALSRNAWNILMCAELCNNVSRYDGVKYGYRTPNYTNLEDLYINSRTEAFGKLLKGAILFGSETLSTENYQKVYDKALRTRRLITEAFAELFASYDAVLLPACSALAYRTEDVAKEWDLSFRENAYTAPALVTGLPAAVVCGVQMIAPAYGEETLFALAQTLAKEVQ